MLAYCYHSVNGISYGLAQSDPIKRRPQYWKACLTIILSVASATNCTFPSRLHSQISFRGWVWGRVFKVPKKCHLLFEWHLTNDKHLSFLTNNNCCQLRHLLEPRKHWHLILTCQSLDRCISSQSQQSHPIGIGIG
jgi:hypothetical protein